MLVNLISITIINLEFFHKIPKSMSNRTGILSAIQKELNTVSYLRLEIHLIYFHYCYHNTLNYLELPNSVKALL